MTLRKRLQVLEGRKASAGWVDSPPVLIGLIDATDDDVTGIRAGPGSEVIVRQPGEPLDDLIARARPKLATPWAGLPLIMAYTYTND